MENNTDCYITLSSKAQSVFFPNKSNNFKVKLKQEVDLSNGNWKVALTKITFPFTWYNLEQENAKLSIIHTKKEDSSSVCRLFSDEEMRVIAIANRAKGKPESACQYFDKTEINLLPGYYDNAAELTDYMVKEFKFKNYGTQYERLSFLSYSMQNGNRSFLFGQEAVLFTNASKFVDALKLSGGEGSPSSNSFLGKIVANSNFEKINNIYVYSNIVDHNLVGDSSYQLLTLVPVEGKYGNYITYSPFRPEYKPVAKNIISDIEIQLNRANGDLIKFQSGSIDITLHFKRE